MVAEIDPEIVGGLRAGGNHFMLNIAHSDRSKASGSDRSKSTTRLTPGSDVPDRRRGGGCERSARPFPVSVDTIGGEGSIRQVLADGLRMKAVGGGPPCIVYAAENHNRAAEILEARVREAVPPESGDDVFRNVCFLNTVIGKMSGLITGSTEMREMNLSPVTPGRRRPFWSRRSTVS